MGEPQQWAHDVKQIVHSKGRVRIFCICGKWTDWCSTSDEAMQKYRAHTGLVERGPKRKETA
jgi:hypothetical protein